MSDLLKDYFTSKCKGSCKKYDDLLECCKKVKEFTAGNPEKWHSFFNAGSLMIEKIASEGRHTNEYHVKEKSLDFLKQENKEIHRDKLPEYYKTSFLNPEYSVKVFDRKFGRLNSVFFTYLMSLAGNCQQYHIPQMENVMKLYCDYFMMWFDSVYGKQAETGKNVELDYEKFHNRIKSYNQQYLRESFNREYTKRFSYEYDSYVNWVMETDLRDIRYLFYYGNYVSENEIRTAEFLNSLPQEKIDRVMHQTAKAYIMGFEEGNKDYKKKQTVILSFRIGMERLARSLIKELESKYRLKVLIPGLSTCKYDQQYQYDHRFDNALFLDKDYADFMLKVLESVNDNFQPVIEKISGGIYFDPFGEKPFAPKDKNACLKYTEEQIQLSRQIRSTRSMLLSKYYKRSETSFCIIGFPTPDIGKNFEEIFDKTIEINMLEHDKWLDIQKYMIDALDQADRVHILGRKKNKTDIYVKLPKLKKPKKQTNFCNCGATVNIPVGEVFNTPQLKGTNGLLHVPSTFLNSFLYKDLELVFKNGRITSYNCKNYKTDKANKKYIEENLMFPHKSLPMSEFAIGTNTLAYAVAKKYKILSLLPILIIEKMGPHFAIGDTCYSREEDTPVFNPDGKEIISRDNEQSIIRKKDEMKAYLQVHTDITLPYDEIGLIQAIKANGDTIDIVKNGKFVLKGTKDLNKYFKI